ncbi:MAG: nuclear transport factor 2 family protein [Ramlibacter sp.]
MTPESLVQAQLDAYNAHDLQAFTACYSDAILVYRPPAAEPVLAGKAAFADFYATQRFNRPALHAQVLNRMVLGNKVVDHERITGLGDAPLEALAVYEISGGLITAVWFFHAA